MQTYMFITKEDFEPEQVELSSAVGWSCSKSTRAGDFALVYVGGTGVSYEWRAVSDAYENVEWGYMCNVEFVRAFDLPITIQELRASIPKNDWNPPYQNFRGFRSILVPPSIADRIRALRSKRVLSLHSVELDFAAQVKESLVLPAAQRVKRLSSASPKPKLVEVVATVYLRNPDVAAEVLTRAGGKCEACKSAAPFHRASDGSPYLEVHHRVRLADGGDDTMDNVLALCPNCHRRAHYGANVAQP